MTRHAPSRLVSNQTYSPQTLRLVAACFFLSGATGLIYEVLWARLLGLVFGATTLAVSIVLAAFMGGLALGSALAGRSGARVKRPVRAYGLLEIGIALYALAVPLLFSLVDNLHALIWQQLHPGVLVFSLWRLLLSTVLLLVPTTLMGATLPLLAGALAGSAEQTSISVTRLYARNLAGAICGSLLAGFVLLPGFGVRATIYSAALINIIIGLATMLADRRSQPSAVFRSVNAQPADNSETLFASRKPPDSDDPDETENRESMVHRDANTGVRALKFWMFCAFVSGFVTISTQVAWTRMLTMIVGSSTYAFSIAVALFLLGLAGGAYVTASLKPERKLRDTILKVELATAASLFLSLAVVSRIPGFLIAAGLRLHVSTWGGLLMLQIVSIALLILLPAFLMGMVMPLVLAWATSGDGTQSVRLVGRSYALNTVGAISGAFGAGFVLIPRFTTRFTIIFAAVLSLLVAGLSYTPGDGAGDRDLRRAVAAGLTFVMIVVLLVAAPRVNLAELSLGAYDSLVRVLGKSRGGVDDGSVQEAGPDIHELLLYEEGPTATVSVRKDWDITSMAINGRTNASDREDMPTQVMLGQLPVLLAPGLRNALVVGYATGVTAGSLLQSPISRLECVELEPATIRGSRFFEHVNNHPLADPRLHLVIDDARTYLRVTPNRYDIIVSEPSHPWVPGVANLFTREFFQLGHDRLTDEGIFVQWLQIYQLSTDSLRSVLATFQETFPHVLVFRVEGATKGKDLLLVGSRTAMTMADMKLRVSERIRDPRVAAELARVGLKSEADVNAWYVCDETRLGPAVAGAIINTDDNMHIETTVPREAFQQVLATNGRWIESLLH
jgi:spermidine synthase